jgi:hypothetical protein
MRIVKGEPKRGDGGIFGKKAVYGVGAGDLE